MAFSIGGVACSPSLPSVSDLPASAPDAAPAFDDLPADPAAGTIVWQAAGQDGGTRPGAGASTGRDAGAIERDSGSASKVGDAGADARAASDAGADRGVSARAPHAGEIVIDELLVDPSGNDLGHEWIEIANVTTEPLDLGNLHLSDGDVDVAVSAGVLPASGLLVLGQSADPAHNGGAPVDLAYGTRLSLNNGADRISACLGACADELTLDSVVWTAPWGDDYVGHAVVIERDGTTCPASEPYGTAGNYGSPGRANALCERPKLAPPQDGGVADGAADR